MNSAGQEVQRKPSRLPEPLGVLPCLSSLLIDVGSSTPLAQCSASTLLAMLQPALMLATSLAAHGFLPVSWPSLLMNCEHGALSSLLGHSSSPTP